MGARHDFLNQALLDQHRSVYWGTIQPGCEQRWRIFAVAAYGTATWSPPYWLGYTWLGYTTLATTLPPPTGSLSSC